MDKKELLEKLVKAFHYEMDWESKENIDSAMTLCLPIIEEYAQSKVNNGVLDAVIKCDCKLERHERAKMELDYNKCMDCKKEIQ